MWKTVFSGSLSPSPRHPVATSCTVTSGSWSAWLQPAAQTTCWTKSRMWTFSWTTDTCWSEERTSPRSSGSDPPSHSASGTTSSAADTTRWSRNTGNCLEVLGWDGCPVRFSSRSQAVSSPHCSLCMTDYISWTQRLNWNERGVWMLKCWPSLQPFLLIVSCWKPPVSKRYSAYYWILNVLTSFYSSFIHVIQQA